MRHDTPPPNDDPSGEMPAPPRASSEAASPDGDRLDAIRRRLEKVPDLPVEDRAAVFEDVNEAIVEELGDMEEL